MSRLLLIALLALVLPWSGCLAGDEDELGPQPAATIDDGVSAEDAARPVLSLVEPEPTEAALAAKPGAALRAQLDAGAVALVDLTGEIGIRPEAITFAKGGRMLELAVAALGRPPRRGHRAHGGGRLRSRLRARAAHLGAGHDPALQAGRVPEGPLLRPRRGSRSTPTTPTRSPTRGWRPRASGSSRAARAGRRAARDGRGARTAGTASGRSARGTSGRPTGPARRSAPP